MLVRLRNTQPQLALLLSYSFSFSLKIINKNPLIRQTINPIRMNTTFVISLHSNSTAMPIVIGRLNNVSITKTNTVMFLIKFFMTCMVFISIKQESPPKRAFTTQRILHSKANTATLVLQTLNQKTKVQFQTALLRTLNLNLHKKVQSRLLRLLESKRQSSTL